MGMSELSLENYFDQVASELSVNRVQVSATAKLLNEECTVPFIARYRKEVTGNLDEVQIISIRDRLEQLRELDERKVAILKSLEEHGHLNDELEALVKGATTLSKLEDIYLPYRPKRKTRGMKAKEQGLEPLANFILAQSKENPYDEAKKYINPQLSIENEKQAIDGAKDIIAEIINEDVAIRELMRNYFEEESILTSAVIKEKEKEQEALKYQDYFEWSEKAIDSPSHRILAIRRGASEGYISYSVLPQEDKAISILLQHYIKDISSIETNQNAILVKEAAEDCYGRLLSLSMETEMKSLLKHKADEKAISVFAQNLRELLLASPMGQKILLALDPGLRTGCKLVCLDAQGKLLYNSAIYPLEPHNKTEEARLEIERVVKHYHIEAVAIGNGTGGREALAFCKSLDCLKDKIVAMVNESGASVYSASEIARKEFPDYDVTVRGAVSIGRRLMDPLAELVKIDPKSIGVGQYQHDVDQKQLRSSLDDVVVSCVNAVGVDVNTASFKLLSYVAGLSERIATRIVSHREINGPFKNRQQFKEVVGVGPKVFEQAAGFLRIPGGDNPLDASAVHPERYELVNQMASDLGCDVIDLIKDNSMREKIDLKRYVSDAVGMPTLTDILKELEKPGRDPRAEFDLFSFTEGVNSISDLKEGMVLPGVVTNVTAFGAFVDIGVHQDGLVHISQLSNSYISDPSQVVKVNQKVQVRVTQVDIQRKRIALSMRSDDVTTDSALKTSASNKQKVVVVKSHLSSGATSKEIGKGKKNEFHGHATNGENAKKPINTIKDDAYNPFAILLQNKK